MHQIPIILASASPRRREILSGLGYTFQVIPARGEEIISSNDPEETVLSLAHQKAAEVMAAQNADPLLVVGADTIVVKNGQILGKPKDEADAFRMLSMLQGSDHLVYTGVCLILRSGAAEQTVCFREMTKVFFKAMTPEEIRTYIATGDPMDKAGAYGIQNGAKVYIDRIDGDYTNVVGLPARRLAEEVEKLLHPHRAPQKVRLEILQHSESTRAPRPPERHRESAVLIPLIETEEGYDILFEQRAMTLKHQPGDICLPGGMLEDGESPLQAAVRETQEELKVRPDQIRILFPMDAMNGPADRPVWPAVALLTDYAGTYAPQEVDHTFRVPLSFFLEEEPERYRARRTTVPAEDFPFEQIAGGRDYWNKGGEYDILFYHYEGTAIWGATARIVHAFIKLFRDGR